MVVMRFCHRGCGVVPLTHRHVDPEKERARRADPNQRAIRGIGAIGRAWRRERAAFLRANPICQFEDGCLARASHVHHIDGRGPTGERGLDHSNFLGLCPTHHGVVEDRERDRDAEGKWLPGGGA